jgi:cold shock CspA family protein
MAQSAMTWDIATEGGSPAFSDAQMPIVLPVRKQMVTRRVGVVRSYSPPKSLGLVIDEDGAKDAIFCIDDVVPCDREKIALGQSVSFHAVTGSDGLAAKQIRIDTTTLPPPPPDTLISRGWR